MNKFLINALAITTVMAVSSCSWFQGSEDEEVVTEVTTLAPENVSVVNVTKEDASYNVAPTTGTVTVPEINYTTPTVSAPAVNLNVPSVSTAGVNVNIPNVSYAVPTTAPTSVTVEETTSIPSTTIVAAPATNVVSVPSVDLSQHQGQHMVAADCAVGTENTENCGNASRVVKRVKYILNYDLAGATKSAMCGSNSIDGAMKKGCYYVAPKQQAPVVVNYSHNHADGTVHDHGAYAQGHNHAPTVINYSHNHADGTVHDHGAYAQGHNHAPAVVEQPLPAGLVQKTVAELPEGSVVTDEKARLYIDDGRVYEGKSVRLPNGQYELVEFYRMK